LLFYSFYIFKIWIGFELGQIPREARAAIFGNNHNNAVNNKAVQRI